MLVIGGADGVRRMNDVWALDLVGTPTWSHLTAAGPPPSPRHSHSAIFDPMTRRALVFGGYDGALANDTWSLTLGSAPSWNLLLTDGETPAPRKDHIALLDNARRRMLVVGGEQASDTFDSWELSIDQEPRWTRIVEGEPPARRAASAVLVPEENSVALHGGWNVNARRDLWTLRLEPPTHWTIEPPARLPPDRGEVTAVYDSARQRPLVVFATNGTASGVYEPWTVPSDLKSWTALPVVGGLPLPRVGAALALDPMHDRLVSLLGYYLDRFEWRTTNRVWILPLDRVSGWVEVVPEGEAPISRAHVASVYDPVGRRLVLFGGWRHEEPLYIDEWFDDVWTISLGDTMRWESPVPLGVRPPRMAGAEAVYDPDAHRMLVFGGMSPVNQYGAQLLDSVWSLSLGDTLRWEELAIEGRRPRGRWAHRLAWDTARHRAILHGGRSDYGISTLPEVWALDGGDRPRWQELSMEGPTIGLDWPGLTYDPVHDRILVFGVDNVVRTMEFPSGEPQGTHEVGSDLLTVTGPNPAHGAIHFRLELSGPGLIFLDVFDIAGRRVRRIMGETLASGVHPQTWDARDDRGQMVPGGLYFVQARSSSLSQTRRVVMLR